MTEVRKGQAPDHMAREDFRERFRAQFYDPAYRPHDAAIDKLEAIAWDAYSEGRKAPVTEKAGPGFADPDYDLSVEWREARDRICAADAKRREASTASRVLVVCGSSRNDGTCPGETSKTYRLTEAVCDQLRSDGIEPDLLDL
ncbi:MAG TPA: NADPH-dependent FMN reductase, partial [Burkholderiales bacterium]|nr:NADPH-dependent FMN reductase [Burkholderiales bacterium]